MHALELEATSQPSALVRSAIDMVNDKIITLQSSSATPLPSALGRSAIDMVNDKSIILPFDATGDKNTSLETSSLVILTYNVRSLLLCMDDKLDMLFEELRGIHWDVLVLVETWREECEEMWPTVSGHLWCGSGGSRGKHGVGILVHSRWTVDSFRAINDRVCSVDINTGVFVLRVIAIYMPTTDSDDASVESVYTSAGNLLTSGRQKGAKVAVAGDFNAHLTVDQVSDDGEEVVGHCCYSPIGDARGDWLTAWCMTFRLFVANTFANTCEKSWIYQKAGVHTQIDFILLDMCLRNKLSEANVREDVDIGSDHRPVFASLCLAKAAPRKRKRMGGHAIIKELYTDALTDELKTLSPGTPDLHSRAARLEKAMVNAAAKSMPSCRKAKLDDPLQKQIREKILQRRAIYRSTNISACEKRARCKDICKEVQKLQRQRSNAQRHQKIAAILDSFRGLRQIARINRVQRNTRIASIVNKHGQTVTERKSIVDVFAKFYEDLYARRTPTDYGAAVVDEDAQIVFTMAELIDALKRMKNGKAQDDQGVVAEMIKHGSEELWQLILDLFNDVLSPIMEPPDSWRHSRLVVLFKKDDPKLPKNYRPIAILPILYKLFSNMFCHRLHELVMPSHPTEQAAYRKGFSTEDHLLAARLVIEASREHNADLFLALVDFEKAFDTVDHGALWRVLSAQGVPPAYTQILQKLYKQQTAVVSTDSTSRQFDIQRGVKQGDPVSALLFVLVIDQCMRNLQNTWRTANSRRSGLPFGLHVDAGDTLTNLRFADDVLLFASSRADIQKMLTHFKKEASKYGLKMHAGKTKVLTNCKLPPRLRSITINDEQMPILEPTATEMYLGCKLCAAKPMDDELDHRLKAAWASFSKFKTELCDKRLGAKVRVKLFEAVVSPRALYGSAAWALTQQQEQKLTTTRRRMLRMMFARRWLGEDSGEAWPDYMSSVTRHAETLFQRFGGKDWILAHRIKKWRFAGKTARRNDNRWTYRLLNWTPCHGLGRKAGRPHTRWADDLCKFAGSWTDVANDVDFWSALEVGFAERL